ncbi:preprotein translocase subunit SecG [Mycoplasmopsis pulmonis]|uniref:preprotein translocase subunit SecG n=1 Tax=Mycoplasmopsis pulmonis TaxID=2107 RepID=UPI00059BF936|nr:preprotein translocase subunit SecG [Mycoplasmopsis pulmonis]MDZ7293308.1 preprotein translocase subunit SecG [Mycoplasmopsis pulmonis]
MSAIAIVVLVFLVICSLLIIILSLITSPDSNGFSGALVGSGDLELFKFSKERGFKKFSKYAMFVLGFFVIILAILLKVLLQ